MTGKSKTPLTRQEQKVTQATKASASEARPAKQDERLEDQYKSVGIGAVSAAATYCNQSARGGKR